MMAITNFSLEPTPDETAERSSIIPSREGSCFSAALLALIHELSGYKSPLWRGAPIPRIRDEAGWVSTAKHFD
jgi:hypothetical protein